MVAADRLECCQRIVVPLQRADVGGVVEIGQPSIEARRRRNDSAGRLIEKIAQRGAGPVGKPLSEETKGATGFKPNRAEVWSEFARKQRKEGRFADAVDAHQTDPVAWVDGKGNALKKETVAKAFGEITDG